MAEENALTADSGDEKISRKTIIYIVIAVLCILALLTYLIVPRFLHKDDGNNTTPSDTYTSSTPTGTEEGDGGSHDRKDNSTKDDGTDGSPGSTEPSTTEDYSKDQNEHGEWTNKNKPIPYPTTISLVPYTPDYLPKKEKIDNPAPTEAKLPPVEPGEIEAHATYDPRSMSPDMLAETHLQDMFSFDITENGGLKKSMEDVINKFGTERAKKVGFRPWWIGDPNKHVPEWDMMKLRGDMKVVTAVQPEGSERISNNVIRYDYTLMPRLNSKNSTTRLRDVKAHAYMEYHDGAWLLDAYDIDDNTPMEIY